MGRIDRGGRLPPGGRSRPRPVILALAIAAVLVPLILACGEDPAPQRLKTAPASQLQLSLRFDSTSSEASHPLPPDKVFVTARFQTAQVQVLLSGGQTLTCDGTDVAIPTLLDRQPPGGKYICMYTDERGQRTTVVVPVPTGTLAITNPPAGASVPIPPPLPHATPLPPKPGLKDLPPRVLHGPLAITYTLPTVPPGGQAFVSATAGCPPSPDGLACDKPYGPTVYGPESAVHNGTYVLADSPSSISGFDYLAPGPGYVMLTLATYWSPAPQGFQQVDVDMRESVTNPVTWTPSQP
jgi:hypothetical protein